MSIDKSTRQHYAIQGGGPNYLGKQKMVKAPKKWKSSPDHEPAELAYITKKEKDILLDLNLYGSLKNGKPNRGPSGIISLQGDMGGYGGTGGGGGGGGGGNGQGEDRRREAAKKAMQATIAAAEKKAAAQKAKVVTQRPTDMLNITGDTGAQKKITGEVGALQDKIEALKKRYPNQRIQFEDPDSYVDIDKYMRRENLYPSKDVTKTIYPDPDLGTEIVPGDETFEPVEKYITPIRHPTVNTNEEADKLNLQNEIRDMITQQQEEKYDVPVDPTKFGEGYETVKPDLRTEKETIEDWERSQDWDKVKELSKKGIFKKGHDFKEIQDAMEKGLLTKTDPRSMQSNLFQKGISSLRNLIPRTGLERNLLGGLKKSFAPTEGGQFSLKGMASNFAKQKLKTMALQKLGLGAVAPWLGVASMFGFDPMGWAMNKFSRKPKDMTAFNKLGLQADRYPTGTTEQARVGAGVRGVDIPTQQAIAGGKGLETEIGKRIAGKSNISPELAALMAKGKSYSEADIIPSDVDYSNLVKLADASTGSPYTTGQDSLLRKHNYDPAEVGGWKNNEGLKLLKSLTDWNTRAADGGRIGAAGGGLINLYRYGGFSG